MAWKRKFRIWHQHVSHFSIAVTAVSLSACFSATGISTFLLLVCPSAMDGAVTHAVHDVRLSDCVYEVLIEVIYAGNPCWYNLNLVVAFE